MTKWIFLGILIFCSISTLLAETSHLPECTAELQDRHFPSDDDCQTYYTCFDGVFVRQTCSNGLWFQREKETCESSGKVFDCVTTTPGPTNPTTTPSATTTSATTPSTTTQSTTTQSTTTTLPTTTSSTTTSTVPTTKSTVACTLELQGQHFPSGIDCSTYKTCYNGRFILQKCPSGYFFQRTSQTCAIESDVTDCEFSTNTAFTTEVITTKTTENVSTETTSPHPLTCTVDIQGRHYPSGFDWMFCTKLQRFILQKCPDDYYFQRSRQTCALMETVMDCEFA
ncbi:CLUMA_CG000944, isoform A [Clunio marinus]|uniref:CLUMA_CG000944, isoform A n=1 Tax=Clunio marinus TaxID=568069 RepID=A0A1J1HGK1_9DIPT|nr:CLUMA_CG000944, isoform A [Clunio marinus]